MVQAVRLLRRADASVSAVLREELLNKGNIQGGV